MTEPMEQDDDEPLSKVVEREDPGDTGLAKNSSGQPFLFFFCTEESAPKQVTVTHRDALRRSSDSFAFLLGATYGFCKHKMNLLNRKVRRSAKTDFDCTLSSIHVLIHSSISSDSNSAEKRSLAETETVLIESDSVKTEVVEAG